MNTELIDRNVETGAITLFSRRRPGPVEPPLLLVQGLGGSLSSWQPLLDAMPDRDVVMIDNPGVGRSERPTLPLRIPGIADRLVAAATSLGIEQFDLVGHSLGGVISQEIAHRHPERVRRLVLTGTIYGIGAMPGKLSVQRRLWSTKRYRDRATAERDYPILGGGRTARDPQVLADFLNARESHPPSVLGFYFQAFAAAGWSSYLWLPQLKVPTLVLHGDEDPVVPVVNARRLAARIPGARLEIVKGAGHMLPFDESDKVAAILDEFFGTKIT